MNSELQLLWDKRNLILAQVSKQRVALREMPIQVQVWFNAMAAEIINTWNAGRCSVLSNDLLKRILHVMKVNINPDEWDRALRTFCLPNIRGAMNFLIFTDDPQRFIIHYPEIESFMNSELGQQFGPALEMLYGISISSLRKPAPGLETDWVNWLKENFPVSH